MQAIKILCSAIFIVSVSLILLSCSSSPFVEKNKGFPDPEDGVATDILLSVYSNGYGTLLDTVRLETEGEIVIDVEEENPFSDPPAYYIYATATGYYTELYFCSKGESITVDLDRVPNAAASMTGVVFATRPFDADCYYANRSVYLRGNWPYNHDPGVTVMTDSLGRYGLTGVDLGPWALIPNDAGLDQVFDLINTIGTDYSDIFFLEAIQVLAPNLYLYPETETGVSVTLDFPSDGYVTVSEPEYGDGWNVNVTPDGFIDGAYGYLFYEATVVMPLQSSVGWMLDGKHLERELRVLLGSLGFEGRAIDDFVEYWVPRLAGSAWYAFYPQDAEQMSILNISPVPDKVLRALFVIRPLRQPIPVTAPVVTPLVRDGFTAVEWGVIGWEE